jgi:hypothetical protein
VKSYSESDVIIISSDLPVKRTSNGYTKEEEEEEEGEEEEEEEEEEEKEDDGSST